MNRTRGSQILTTDYSNLNYPHFIARLYSDYIPNDLQLLTKRPISFNFAS